MTMGIAMGGSGNVSSAYFDALFGSTRGMILRREASAWAAYALGANNLILSSDGTDVTYRSVTSLLDSLGSTNGQLINRSGGSWTATTLSTYIDAAIGNTQGNILYRGASTWDVLAPGTSGQGLTTGGSGANPSWSNIMTNPMTTNGDLVSIIGGSIARIGIGSAGQFATTNGTVLQWSNTLTSGAAPALEIDSSATSGTLARINFPSGVTQAGAYIGFDLDVTTNLTTDNNAITGLRISTDNTTAAAAAGQGALVINSDATLARVLDIDCANVGGTLVQTRFGSAVSITSTLIGNEINLQTNVTGNAQVIIGQRIFIPATTRSNTNAEAALVIQSLAVDARVIDLDVRNTGGNLAVMRVGAATTWTGNISGWILDLSTNVTNAAQIVDAYATTQLLSSTGRTSMLAGTGNNAQTCDIGWWSENLTLSVAGATTNTTNTIPADAFILQVDAYITTSITGVNSTSVQIGDSTTATRFGSLSALTAGTTDVMVNHLQGSIGTDATGPIVTAATTVRVTLAGGADNTPTAGAVRITVRYIVATGATS